MSFVKKIIKYVLVIVIAAVLGSVGLDAVDHRGSINESVVGRIFFGTADSVCPAGMVLVEGSSKQFCIDQFEVSAGENCPHQDVSSEVQSKDNIDTGSCMPISKIGTIPWRYITKQQAANACAKAGKRLPTNEEWFAASLGTPDPNDQWGMDDCHVNKNWGALPGLTGSGKNCQSGAGAYDMVGNVWEWVTGEAIDGVFENRILPESGFVKEADSNGVAIATDEVGSSPTYNKDYFWQKNTGQRAMARGGFWDNGQEAGLYSMYLEAPFSFVAEGVGFRCVK